MRPVFTKWETSRKIIIFLSYGQVHIFQIIGFKMIYNIPGILPYLGTEINISLRYSFVFCYLLTSLSELSFILREQASYSFYAFVTYAIFFFIK